MWFVLSYFSALISKEKYVVDVVNSYSDVTDSYKPRTYRLRAKKGPAPPLGNFADISYLEENFKLHLLRDVCTLCSGALVSDSLLHMLL